jgi:hypothetical protein
MGDTHKEIEERYKEMLLARSPSEKLRMASGMYDSARRLVIAGVRIGNRQLSASQLRGQLFLRMYAHDFTVAEREKIVNRIPDMQWDTDD